MRTRKATTTLITLGLAFVASTAHATLIVSDNFNNATMNATNDVLTSNGRDYTVRDSTSGGSLSAGTLEGDGALHLNSSGNSHRIYITAPLGQSVSLANVGDFIQMDFRFSDGNNTGGNRVLRYGFFNGIDETATGYFLGAANNTGSNSNAILAVDYNDGVNHFYNSNRPSTLGENLEIGHGSKDFTPPADAWFRVERISATEIRLSGQHGDHDFNGNTLTHTITATSAESVDHMWFGIYNRDTNFTIDNLQISAIPEPSTLFLVGSVLIGFLLVNKTRRR